LYTWLIYPLVLFTTCSVYSAGAFLVRPSETEPGGYAIVFRTKDELKRWKIVRQDGQYLVHPRPQKYPNLEKIVEVRR